MKKGDNLFWISFTDLITSLFFIVLVLYVITFISLKKEQFERTQYVEDLEHKLEVYTLVEQNLKPLQKDSILFRYESDFKRFTLAFDVNFEVSQYEIRRGMLMDFENTSEKIKSVGDELQKTIDDLLRKKSENPQLEKVSYLVIIAGYASQLNNATQINDYLLSYRRAYSLWNYWKILGIDFEEDKYSGLIDLQIAGNGWGGVGRFPRLINDNFDSEKKNQRFIIQIIPKIGNTD